MGQSGHLYRRGAVGDPAQSQLSHAVASPCPDRAVGPQGEGKQTPFGLDRYDTVQVRYPDWQRIGIEIPHAVHSVIAGAPGPHRSIGTERQVVISACSDADNLRQAAHLRWNEV